MGVGHRFAFALVLTVLCSMTASALCSNPNMNCELALPDEYGPCSPGACDPGEICTITGSCCCSENVLTNGMCYSHKCTPTCASTGLSWSAWSDCTGCTASCASGCTGTQTRTDLNGCSPPETRSCTIPQITCGFYICYEGECCAPGAGSSCQSAPNSCGQTATGTKRCDGSCAATPPPESSCGCAGSPPACGRCGTKSCVSGSWSDVCTGEGACTPGATEPCTTGGSRTCMSNCQWGNCMWAVPLTCGSTVCASGQLCCNEQCITPCVSGTCGAGYVCSNPGTCYSMCAQAPACGTSTCSDNQLCCNDNCQVPACTPDSCPDGYVCADAGTCAASCVPSTGGDCDSGTFQCGTVCCTDDQTCSGDGTSNVCVARECSHTDECGAYPDCYSPVWTCSDWACANPAIYPGREIRTCITQRGNSDCDIDRPVTVRYVDELDARNCEDDNCNLKKDEPNALPCCDPGTLGPSDIY